MAETVRAAGGVVRRESSDEKPLYAVIHRPRYDDWTLPKGKLDRGETERDAALREVEEETGIRCRVGRELGSVSYVDSQGRGKTVRYWLMTPEEGEFLPTSEVDEIRWLDAESAMALLSYDRDREVLRAAISGDRVS
jgi:8-oxo-dGTP diphosphatase